MRKEKILFISFFLCVIASVISALYLKNWVLALMFLLFTFFTIYFNKPYLKKMFLENEERKIIKPKVDERLMHAKKVRLKDFLTENKLDDFKEEYKKIFLENRHVLTEVYKQLFTKRFVYAKNFFTLPFKFEHALKRIYETSKDEKIIKNYEFYYNFILSDVFIFTKSKYVDCEELATDFSKKLLITDRELMKYLIDGTIDKIDLNFSLRKFVDKDDIMDVEYIFTCYYLSRIIVKVINVLEKYNKELKSREDFINFIYLGINEYKDYRKVISYLLDKYRDNYSNLIIEEDFILLIYLLCLDYNARIIDNGYDLNIPRILYKYEPLYKSYKNLNVSEQVLAELDKLKPITTSNERYFNISYEQLLDYCITHGKVTPEALQKEFNITYDGGVFLINYLEENQFITEGDYIMDRDVLIASIPEYINKDEYIIRNHFYNYIYNLNLVIPETVYNTILDICRRDEDKGVIYHNKHSIINKILYNYLPNKSLEDQLIAIESSNYWYTIIDYLLKNYNQK